MLEGVLASGLVWYVEKIQVADAQWCQQDQPLKFYYNGHEKGLWLNDCNMR